MQRRGSVGKSVTSQVLEVLSGIGCNKIKSSEKCSGRGGRSGSEGRCVSVELSVIFVCRCFAGRVPKREGVCAKGKTRKHLKGDTEEEMS